MNEEEYFLHYDHITSKIIKKNKEDKNNIFIQITNIQIANFGKEKSFTRQLSSFKFIPFEINQSNFLKVYENLIENSKEAPFLYSEPLIIDGNVLILNRKSINYILTVIKSIIGEIKHNKEFEEKLYKFAYLGIVPKINKNFSIMGENIENILENFNCIQTIIVNIYNKDNFKMDMLNSYRNDIRLNDIMLFSFFFNSLFPYVSSIEIDLNIIPINEKFFSYKDNFNENTINNLAENYKDLFISNFIILNIFYTCNHIFRGKIKMYDSYLLELQNIFSKELFSYSDISQDNFVKIEKSINNDGNLNISIVADKNLCIFNYSKELNNSIIYFDKMIILNKEHNFLQLELNFNSLDPLLFEKINLSILNTKKLSYLKLSLFPDTHISLHKLLINQNFYLYYSQGEKLCLYDPNIKLNKKSVLNKLFESFQNNLEFLYIILETKINHQALNSIYINFSTYYYYEIDEFDNYNSSISCFIFNFLLSLQRIEKKKLNYLHLIVNNPNNLKIALIQKLLFKYNNSQKINLSNLGLTNLYLEINNISSILSFIDLPLDLKQLNLFQTSEKDLDELIILLSKNNHKLLQVINISFDYNINISFEKFQKFFSLINNQFEEIIIEFPYEILIESLYDVILSIKNNGNFNTLIKFKFNGNFFESYPKQSLKSKIKSINNSLNENNKMLCIFNTKSKLYEISIDIYLVKKNCLSKAIEIIFCLQKIKGEKIKTKIFFNIFHKLNFLMKKTIKFIISKIQE